MYSFDLHKSHTVGHKKYTLFDLHKFHTVGHKHSEPFQAQKELPGMYLDPERRNAGILKPGTPEY